MVNLAPVQVYCSEGDLCTIEVTRGRILDSTVFCLLADEDYCNDPRRRFEITTALQAGKPIALLVRIEFNQLSSAAATVSGAPLPLATASEKFLEILWGKLNKKIISKKDKGFLELLRKVGNPIEYFPRGTKRSEMIKTIMMRGRHRCEDVQYEMNRLLEASVLIVGHPGSVGMWLCDELSNALVNNSISAATLDMTDDVDASFNNAKALVVVLTDEVFSNGHVILAVKAARVQKKPICMVCPDSVLFSAVAHQARMKGLVDMARLVLENTVVQFAMPVILPHSLDAIACACGLPILVSQPGMFDPFVFPTRKAFEYQERSRETTLNDVRQAMYQHPVVVFTSSAGTGKTVMMAELVLESNGALKTKLGWINDMRAAPIHVGGFHFFNHACADEINLEFAIRSLCRQLCALLPSFRTMLPFTTRAEADQYFNKVSSLDPSEMAMVLLKELIVDPAKKLANAPSSKCVLVIDGLDECPHAEALMHAIQTFWVQAPPWLGVVISARLRDPIGAPGRQAPGMAKIAYIKITPEQLKADMTLVTNNRLKEKWGQNLSGVDKITDWLVARAEGSFLWLKYHELQLKILCEKKCLNFDGIKTFPNGIDNTYRDRFARLFVTLGRETKAYRAFVSFAVLLPRSPMPEAIFKSLLQNVFEGDFNDEDYFERKIRTPATFLGIFNPQKREYQSAHKSMKDWLMGLGDQSSTKVSAWDLHLVPGAGAHEFMAQELNSRVENISLDGFEFPKKASGEAQYAMVNAVYHFTLAGNVTRAQEYFVDFQKLYWQVAAYSLATGGVEHLIRDGKDLLHLVSAASSLQSCDVEGVRLCLSFLQMITDSICTSGDPRQLAGQVLGRVLPAATESLSSFSASSMGGRPSISGALGGLQRRVSFKVATPSAAAAPLPPPTKNPLDRRMSTIFGSSPFRGKNDELTSSNSISASAHSGLPPLSSAKRATPSAAPAEIRRTNNLAPAVAMRTGAVQWIKEATTKGNLRVCAPRLWCSDLKPAGGSLIRVWSNACEVNGVSASNGNRIAVGLSDGKIDLLDWVSGMKIRTFEGHAPEVVWGISLSWDGTRLISGSKDKTARIWDANSGKLMQTLKGHTGWVMAVKISSDVKMCFTASFDSTSRMWEMASGKCVNLFEGHSASVNGLAITNSHMATASSDKTCRVWDLSSGKTVSICKGHSREVFCVEFILVRGAMHLLSGSADQNIVLWADVTTAAAGKPICAFQGHHSSVLSIAACPLGDGQFVSSSGDKTVRVWNVESGLEVKQYEGHFGSVLSVAFSPDGKMLASASKDRNVRQWQYAEATSVGHLDGHTKPIIAVAVSSDGKLGVTGSLDQTARVWDLTVGRTLHVLTHVSPILSVTLSSDGAFVVAGLEDNSARVWNTSTGNALCVLKGHTGAILCLSVSADGKTCLTGSQDFSCRVWEVASGKTLRVLEHPETVCAVALSLDGKYCMTKGKFGTRCWDLKTGKEAGDAVASGFGNMGIEVGTRTTFKNPGCKILQGDVSISLDNPVTFYEMTKATICGPSGTRFFVWEVVNA